MASEKCTCSEEPGTCKLHPNRYRIRAWAVSGTIDEPTRAEIIRLPSRQPERVRVEMRPRVSRDDD